ncbi:MAG: energy-coupling factor transporter transmembrane component T [Actinomycetes bacterium]
MNRRSAHILGEKAAPRWTHPGAWWVWALGLATAASRTTNPLLLALLIAVAGWVVSRRRPDAPWARSYAVFLRLGLAVIAIRVGFAVLLGSGIGTHVIVTLPELPLPSWAAGVSIGGPITAEELLTALYQGAVLAAMLACIGAANSLASPTRLLASVPAALYEVGVAVIVAMSFAPQLVADVSRVRTARRLRGRSDRGIRALAGSAMPVLEGALERAIDLAAAMDSRGYGRVGAASAQTRLIARILLLVALMGICVGVYALLDGGTPGALALPLLALGCIAAITAMLLAGRRTARSRYRPDPWALPEWLVSASGVVAGAVFVVTSMIDPIALTGPTAPPAWPALPLLPVVALMIAALPGLVTPLPPGSRAFRGASAGESSAGESSASERTTREEVPA